MLNLLRWVLYSDLPPLPRIRHSYLLRFSGQWKFFLNLSTDEIMTQCVSSRESNLIQPVYSMHHLNQSIWGEMILNDILREKSSNGKQYFSWCTVTMIMMMMVKVVFFRVVAHFLRPQLILWDAAKSLPVFFIASLASSSSSLDWDGDHRHHHNHHYHRHHHQAGIAADYTAFNKF